MVKLKEKSKITEGLECKSESILNLGTMAVTYEVKAIDAQSYRGACFATCCVNANCCQMAYD